MKFSEIPSLPRVDFVPRAAASDGNKLMETARSCLDAASCKLEVLPRVDFAP